MVETQVPDGEHARCAHHCLEAFDPLGWLEDLGRIQSLGDRSELPIDERQTVLAIPEGMGLVTIDGITGINGNDIAGFLYEETDAMLPFPAEILGGFGHSGQ